MVQNSNFEVKKLMKRVLEVNVDDVGYGGVFAFYGSAVGIYDSMGGVNVSLSL